MKVIMRLYRIHDLDLLYLYKIPNFSLQKAIKDAVKAYINNQDLHIDFPVVNDIMLPKSAQFHVYLSETDDAEIIAWLGEIAKGYRNSLLKNITRKYLVEPSVAPYLINNNIFMQGLLKTPSNKIILDKPHGSEKETKKGLLDDLRPQFSSDNFTAQTEEENKTKENFDLFSTFDDMLKQF